jgi:threonine dehydrogenase-like Zn-dependent dehydrogenase
MMEQGRIDPTPMITQTIDLEELPATIEAMQQPGDQIKVIVVHT